MITHAEQTNNCKAEIKYSVSQGKHSKAEIAGRGTYDKPMLFV
jgi:hypothetical protein